jgi:hypothetical protein
MTDWNEKNENMSLAVRRERADNESMTHTNTKQNPAAPDNRAAVWREAIGPGYHAPTFGRAIEGHLNQETGPPTTPNSVTVRDPKLTPKRLRRLLDRVRNHPGYTSTPSQQALDRISHVAYAQRR